MLICDKSGRELRHRILLSFFVVEILTTQESIAKLILQMVISHLGGGGELNLDQTGMCHQCLKFITLFWSGKTQKGYPVLELPLYCIVFYCILLYFIVLYCIVLYCIVLYCIVLYCIVLYCIVLETKIMFTLYLCNQMCLPFPFSSIMFVQKSFKFLLLLSV